MASKKGAKKARRKYRELKKLDRTRERWFGTKEGSVPEYRENQRQVCCFLLSGGRDYNGWHHKVRYRSRGVARKQAREMAKKYPEDEFREYRCPHCGGWHVGRVEWWRKTAAS